MAKGGSKNQVQKSEVTQSNIPEYARPYFEGMMSRANTALTTPYQTYGQERIAGFTPQQLQLQQNIMGMQTPGEFGQASGLASTAGQRSLDFANYTPGQFNADQVRAGPLNYFQMQGPDSFTQSGMAQQYMSPFMQAALEPQRREALRSAQQGQLVQGLGSARQGAYGGSRQLLAGMERERNLGQNLADIQARGMVLHKVSRLSLRLARWVRRFPISVRHALRQTKLGSDCRPRQQRSSRRSTSSVWIWRIKTSCVR
jgi:hypothetical protein